MGTPIDKLRQCKYFGRKPAQTVYGITVTSAFHFRQLNAMFVPGD